MDTLLDKYVLSGGPMMVLLIPCSLLAVGEVPKGVLLVVP